MSTHDCLAGPACHAGKTIAGQRRPATTEQPDTLCPACSKRITDAIRQLPRDWQELRDALGDRTISDGPKINSTPEPVILVNARREALMANITETAVRAAELVADALNADSPFPNYGRRGYPAREAHSLKKAVRLVEPNTDLLANAPTSEHLIWNARGYALDYDDNPFTVAELSGIDITLQLVDLHHQTRSELGKTRLRHRYAMPCPHCGGRVGRDDGQTVVDCDKCESSWTEREYKFLAGLIVDERQDMEITKYLLAEAYWRLDRIAKLVNTGAQLNDGTLELPGAGKILNDFIAQALDGHKPPADRVIATTKTITAQRQDDEDTWQWGDRPTAYKPPKPKRKRQRTTHAAGPAQHIHPGSTTTLVDIDEALDTIRGLVCPQCNIVHAGECP